MDDERLLPFAGAARRRRHHTRLRLVPDNDLKVIVVSLMEALASARERLNSFDRTGKLKRLYEQLRCQLEVAGFPVGHETPFVRAAAHRRLGELAESRGDLAAAKLHYELAIRSRKDVGCRRALERLDRNVLCPDGDTR